MDAGAALGWALPVGLGIAALGCSLGIGRAVASALDAVARQPEAGTKILMYMTIGCAFIEALTIYVLVFAFVVSAKIPG